MYQVVVAQRKKLKGTKRKSQLGSTKLLPAGYQYAQVFDEVGRDVTPLPLNDLNSQRSEAWADLDDFSQICFLEKVKEKFMLKRKESIDTSTPIEDLPKEKVHEKLKPEDRATITLKETDTIWLFSLESLMVSVESEEAEQLKKSNTNYKELLRTRIGNDRYVERGMQTLNELPKVKGCQTDPVVIQETGAQSSIWDMWESFQNLAVSGPNVLVPSSSDIISAISPEKGETPQITFQKAEYLRMIWLNPAKNEYEPVNIPYPGSIKTDLAKVNAEKILSSQKFKDDLFFMERILNMNTYQAKQAMYRGLPIYREMDDGTSYPHSRRSSSLTVSSQRSRALKPILLPPLIIGPYLKELWKFSFPLAEGFNVSCIAWNKANPELFAVGHGQFEYRGQKGGLICCWSLKNTEYPERIFTNDYGVMTLAFSVNNPSLLCAGLYNGNIVIYNVQSKKDKPLLDNSETEIIQKGPICQVQWIKKSAGKTVDDHEAIVSVGMDGQVLMWMLRKGLECTELMKLRRIPHPLIPSQKEKREDALLSKYAAGYCLEFHPSDNNAYLVGTEEGHIHRCSRSYTEQYLTTYMAHTAPVYRIAWSPFLPEIFLTCSADWSIRLWHEDSSQPLMTFYCYTKPVFDVSWSPGSSTVFACVNETSIEIWDLAVSCLDPVYIHDFDHGISPTTISFANKYKRIIVGTNTGDVLIFLLQNMMEPSADQEKALRKVISTTSMDIQESDKDSSIQSSSQIIS